MSKIGKVYFDILQRVQKIFEVYLKYSERRVENKTSYLFFIPSRILFSKFTSNMKTKG